MSNRLTLEGLTHDKIAEFKEAFDLIDADDDGVITKNELSTILRSLGFAPSDEALSLMMREADMDENGTIEFKEFLELMVRTPEQSIDPRMRTQLANTATFNSSFGQEYVPEDVSASLHTIFIIEDPQGTGWVDKAVFVEFLTTRGDCLSKGEMDEVLASGLVPAREDGKVYYSAFIDILTSNEMLS